MVKIAGLPTADELSLIVNESLTKADSDKPPKRLTTPGAITALMLILYGLTRFLLESIRDDNPYEFASMTISQILAIVMIISGTALLILLPYIKSYTLNPNNQYWSGAQIPTTRESIDRPCSRFLNQISLDKMTRPQLHLYLKADNTESASRLRRRIHDAWYGQH